jgi:hypothetical protein
MWGSKNSRRKILIIDHALQHQFIRDVCRFPIIALMVGMLIMAVNFRFMIVGAVTDGVNMPGIWGFIGCMVGYVFLACYVTLNMATRISHRIAGPLYRLHKSIELLQKGDLDCKIKLRDKDYLMETADMFNQLVDTMEKGWKPLSPEKSSSEEEEEKSEKELVGAGSESAT